MREAPFVGRKEELEDLDLLTKKKIASLVVVQGRRRIGKSRLVEEFGKKYQFYQFSGYPPSASTTEQSQRDEFTQQLCLATGLPEIKVDDWSKLFLLLAKEVKEEKCVILFDEISWMGSKDPDFLGKLKNAWDLQFKKNPNLILVLCSSVSLWIEKNILGHTGFMGRISLTLTLNELPLKDCNQLLMQLGSRASAYEKFKILSVTGGIPRYLEEIQVGLTAEENIKRLCFAKKGILFKEFNDIFSDLFSNRSTLYKRIVTTLVDGSIEYNDFCHKLNIPKGGHLSEYLEDLIKSGFVSRDYTWLLKTGTTSRLSHYRLSDNYMRFYLKYIEKIRGKIDHGQYDDKSLMTFPVWDSIMSLQFENLVLNNRKQLWNKLRIYPEEIVADNPFFQRKTVRALGCQIDYLIHTRFNTLYVCEIKFSKKEIGCSVIKKKKKKSIALNNRRDFLVGRY